MKKELKFRVWLKNKKQYIYFEPQKIKHNFYLQRKFIMYLCSGDLEQYIGYSDQNGNDIYTKDIVIDWNTGISGQSTKPIVVTMDNYKLLEKLSRANFGMFEVIGNINKNPELLEK